MAQTITFEGATLDIIDHNGGKWLRGWQIASALGFANPSSDISHLYARNSAEFTGAETALITIATPGGPQSVRIFSARGAWLLGMLARTKRAKAFRRWVLDVLEAHQQKAQVKPIGRRRARARLTREETRAINKDAWAEARTYYNALRKLRRAEALVAKLPAQEVLLNADQTAFLAAYNDAYDHMMRRDACSADLRGMANHTANPAAAGTQAGMLAALKRKLCTPARLEGADA